MHIIKVIHDRVAFQKSLATFLSLFFFFFFPFLCCLLPAPVPVFRLFCWSSLWLWLSILGVRLCLFFLGIFAPLLWLCFSSSLHRGSSVFGRCNEYSIGDWDIWVMSVNSGHWNLFILCPGNFVCALCHI